MRHVTAKDIIHSPLSSSSPKPRSPPDFSNHHVQIEIKLHFPTHADDPRISRPLNFRFLIYVISISKLKPSIASLAGRWPPACGSSPSPARPPVQRQPPLRWTTFYMRHVTAEDIIHSPPSFSSPKPRSPSDFSNHHVQIKIKLHFPTHASNARISRPLNFRFFIFVISISKLKPSIISLEGRWSPAYGGSPSPARPCWLHP
jgi:hypothetical protein